MGTIAFCWSCKKTTEVTNRVFRTTRCAHCHWEIRVCLNCRHHDRGASNECREPVADYVHDKTRVNFCEHFEPAPPPSGEDDAAAKARARLEALFKK